MSTAAWETFDAGTEKPSDEEIEEGGYDEREEEEVDEDEHEHYAEGAGEAVRIGETPGQ